MDADVKNAATSPGVSNDRGRLNLIRLMPRLTELLVYDNSKEADPTAGQRPEPVLLLHMASGRIVSSCDLQLVPQWAKPILAAAVNTHRQALS